MGKKKSSRKTALERISLLPWCSANIDCHEVGGYTKLGSSIFRNENFNNLSFSAQSVYLRMLCECKGQEKFEMSNQNFARFNNIPLATYKRAVKELVTAGFVQKEYSEEKVEAFKTSVIKFCSNWKCVKK